MDPEPALASFKPLASKDADPVTAPPETQDRDVMGDLFSPKESDADRLMDRIHRSLVSNQDPTGCGGDEDPEGFENLIPRRMDQDPIPEISSRLDAFFDLASSTVQPLATESDHSDATVAPDSGDAEQVFGETLPLFEGEEEAPPEKLILLDPDEDSDARSNVGALIQPPWIWKNLNCWRPAMILWMLPWPGSGTSWRLRSWIRIPWPGLKRIYPSSNPCGRETRINACWWMWRPG